MKSTVNVTREGGLQVNGELVEIPEELKGTGGRNLIESTTNEFRTTTFSSWNSRPYGRTLDIKGGVYLTASAYLKSTGEPVTLRIFPMNGSTRLAESRDGNIIPANGEGHVSITTLLPPETDRVEFVIRHTSGNTPTHTVHYKDVKLEYGETATPWAPAPEDLGYDLPDWVQDFGVPSELVGRRNWILNGDFSKGTENWSSSGGGNSISLEEDGLLCTIGTTGYIIPRQTFTKSFKAGDVISVQAEIFSENHDSLNSVVFRFSNTFNVPQKEIIDLGGGWKRYLFQTTRTSDIDITNIIIGFFNLSVGTVFKVNNIKLEINDTHTSWTPAPEDLGWDVLGNEINKINGKAMSLSKGGILTNEIIEYPKELIGGRNLLLNSSNRTFSSYYTNFYFTEPMNSEETYTISLALKITGKTQRFAIFNSTGSNPLQNWYSIPEDRQGIMTTYSFTLRGKIVGANTHIRVYTGTGEGGSVEIDWIKLEKGSTATPYSPAPEDLGLDIPNWVQSFDLPYKEGDNLLPHWWLKNNADISTSTGLELENPTRSRTIPKDYLPVIPGETYTLTRPVNNGNVGTRFYDVEKNFIGNNNLNDSFTYTIKMPDNCHFFKFIDEANTLNQGYKFEKGSTATDWTPASTLGITMHEAGIGVKGEVNEYPDIVQDGLLLWYDFLGIDNSFSKRDTAIDLSGNDIHGDLINFGYVEGSGYEDGLKLDGVDDYIEVFNTTNIFHEGDHTFSVIGKFNTIERTSTEYLMCHYNWSLRIHTDNRVSFRTGRYGDSSGPFVDLDKTIDNPSDWFQVVGVYKPSEQKVQLYLNGELAREGSTNGLELSTSYSQNLRFGSTYHGGGGARNNINIGSVQIYNRALTEQEILHNYHAEKGRWGI